MKAKTKNILSSVFGILILTLAITFKVAAFFDLVDKDFGNIEFAGMIGLGIILLFAWSKVLQGFALKVLGLKKE